MLHSLIPEVLANERRRVLLITQEPSLRSLVSTLLTTMGCACASVSCSGIVAILDRETFDAVLLDADHCCLNTEIVLSKIQERRPSLSTRILVIRSGLTDPQVIELIERQDLRQVSQENLLQQLWAGLEELFKFSHVSKLAPRTMHAAQLIFDSVRSPMAANLRGSRRNCQQLAFQHQNATIDLQIELNERSGRIAIIGQVLHSPGRKGEAEGLPVLVVSGVRTMARTSTNQFGEFRLECSTAQNACVEMRLREGAWVSLPLGRLDWRVGEMPG